MHRFENGPEKGGRKRQKYVIITTNVSRWGKPVELRNWEKLEERAMVMCVGLRTLCHEVAEKERDLYFLVSDRE